MRSTATRTRTKIAQTKPNKLRYPARAGMEQEVAEAFDQRLASPHSVIMGGVMSRKKQVVPILPRVARRWKGYG
jgi:inorganic pyrophosphatase/exopolyphosphatase